MVANTQKQHEKGERKITKERKQKNCITENKSESMSEIEDAVFRE